MAWNNNSQYIGDGFAFSRGYSGGGFGGNNNYQRGNRMQMIGGRPPKRSGCKSGTDRNGKPYVQGWKYDKTNGLRRFYASPYNGTIEKTSKNGKIWQNWFVRVQMPNGQVMKTSGLFDKQTGKVTISQMGFVMNPRGGAGGYVGPFYYKKNR